ncbi:MAG TPA: hypothetical protein VMR52_12960 [Dehalococcoidia bacterium]|nr:hypothetical protein [Dehalococcoidia bacterium]
MEDGEMQNDNSLTAVLLRAYLWLVPIGMLLAAIAFGAVAAVDGRWGLFGVMVVIGVVGVGLGVAHWWVLYRFGKGAS